MAFASGAFISRKSSAVRNATARVRIARAESDCSSGIVLSVVDERLPFQSISIQAQFLPSSSSRHRIGPLVARDAPQAGKNGRQQFFQLQAGTQLTADGDQALLFLKGAVALSFSSASAPISATRERNSTSSSFGTPRERFLPRPSAPKWPKACSWEGRCTIGRRD